MNRFIARRTNSTTSAALSVDHLVIGGGIIGMAIAALLQQHRPTHSVLVVDKNVRLGDEATSRNSEVVHGGIYYPLDSLKTRLCIQGKRELYDWCARHRVPHRKVGKWIVATGDSDAEHAYLSGLKAKCDQLGVPVRFLSRQEWTRDEPSVKASSVLYSPTTGIVDSHALLQSFEGVLSSNSGQISLYSTVTNIVRSASGAYQTTLNVRQPRAPESTMSVTSKTVVNAGGLWADNVIHLIRDSNGRTMPSDTLSALKQHPCKGHYYTLSGTSPVSRLIYPTPVDTNLTGLGVHCTVDLTGRLRLGPDAVYVDRKDDYWIDMDGPAELERRRQFFSAVQRYLNLPDNAIDRLKVDYAGIRPKLSSKQNPGFRDFYINEESRHGFPNLVNLVGIESPGLTACLAIANHIKSIIYPAD